MGTAYPPAITREKRKHNRVTFTRTVKLTERQGRVSAHRARNLSLGGLYLEGSANVSRDERCQVMLSETGIHATMLLYFDAIVTRVDAEGVAVTFCSMEEDAYMFLQTMLLYSSDDPLGVVAEFLEDFPKTRPDFT